MWHKDEMDVGDFLNTLAQKAGVASDVYQNPDTKLFVFRAQVIHERRANCGQ
jgi:AMMECR1 domain-containing protein